MKIERAIEILNPEHREHYGDLEEVNEACRMGMEALRIVKELTEDDTLIRDLRDATEMMGRGIHLPGHRGATRRAAELLERARLFFTEKRKSGGGKA